MRISVTEATYKIEPLDRATVITLMHSGGLEPHCSRITYGNRHVAVTLNGGNSTVHKAILAGVMNTVVAVQNGEENDGSKI